MIRCLVVDDDPMARLVLQHYIGEVPEAELTASCASAAEAAGVLKRGGIDLVFLDFDLPDASGLDMLRTHPSLPATILVTGAQHVADEAVEAGAVACLVKPLSFDLFLEALGRFHRRA